MEKDHTFQDFFGEENPFEKLFGKGFDAKNFRTPNLHDKDPRGTALLMTFREEIIRRDKNYLKQAIVEYKQEIYERTNNSSLLEAYAKAALFTENSPLCYDSLRRIKNPDTRQNQAIGVVAYSLGNYGDAIKSFKTVEKDLSSQARILYSLSLLEIGLEGLSVHKRVLNPLLEMSAAANSILGCLAFNDQDSITAEKYLASAAKLNPKSEKIRLDLMRVMAANEKMNEVYGQMNSFYIDTNSKISSDEVTRQLNERELKVPRILIKNLFTVVNSLLE